MLINGKVLADALTIDLERDVFALKSRNITPKIAIITLGEEESWTTYVGAKIKLAGHLGIDAELINLQNSSEDNLFSTIERINNDPTIHGLIVQRPFPAKYDKKKIIYSIKK